MSQGGDHPMDPRSGRHLGLQRCRACIILVVILFSEKKHIPVSSEYQNLFPVKISSQLTSWQRSTYEEFIETAYTQMVVDAGFVRESDLFFTASVERGHGKLQWNFNTLLSKWNI